MLHSYALDPTRSRFTVQAFAGGILAGFAHNPIFVIRDYSGEMEFDLESQNDASFHLAVAADSIDLADRVPEKDRKEILWLMHEEVLETAAYPKISFRSTQIAVTRIADGWFRALIDGDMQLHGNTGRQKVDAQVRIADGELRLNGVFMLSQESYKIKRISHLGGVIRMKNELTFTFDFLGSANKRTE